MNITDEQIRQFDEFLRGNMSTDERLRFEEKLGSNEELLGAFERHHKSIIDMDHQSMPRSTKDANKNTIRIEFQRSSSSGISHWIKKIIVGLIILFGVALVVYLLQK